MLQYDQWKAYMAECMIARMQVHGVPDNARPHPFATREEVLAMLDRALIQ